jgi:AsmA protein
MRKVGVAIVGVVLVLVVAVFVAPRLVPLDGLKARIATEAGQATGREVKVEGPVRFAVFPHLRLEASGVTLGNVPSGVAKNMASIGTLAIELELWPLLSGTIVLDRLVLIDPVIALEIDPQGKPNWDFAGAKQVQPATPPPSQSAASTKSVQQLRLDDIRLVNGKVSYVDRRTNENQAVDQINVTLALPSLDQPLAAEGSFVWNDKKMDLSLGVAAPRALLNGGDSGLSTRLGGEPVTLGFNGTAALSPALKLVGDVDLEVPSVRGLAAWTGKPLATSGNTLGRLSIKGKLAVAGKQTSFTGALLQLDDTKASGEVMIGTAGARPSIKGRLEVERLDLTPYMTSSTGAPGPAAATAKGSNDWSDAPLDLSALKAANLDFSLSVGSLQAGKITLGKSVLAIVVQDGKLSSDLREMALYQGSGTGRLVIDGSGAVPAMETSFKLAHIAAQPFLKDSIGFERLSGTGAFDIAVTSHGHSERELVGALNGKGAVTFTDGAIQGINLAAMVRNVGSAFLDASAGSAQKTDFAELGGTFTVTNGIVKNDDLDLKSPLLRVSGNGTIDLPHRHIDYRVTPKLVASAEGQGAAGAAAGIMVPVVIQGPLDAPSFQPDLAGMLQQGIGNPNQLLKGLKGLPAPNSKTAPQQPTNPLDRLNELLDKKK